MSLGKTTSQNNNQIIVSSINNKIADTQTRNVKIHYICLCQAIETVLFWTRIVGILPVVVVKQQLPTHTTGCKFKVSKFWIMYSCAIQIFYIPYFVTVFAIRLTCGPDESANISEWYVMTFGYFITDLDSIMSLVMGALLAKKNSVILENISNIPGKIEEMRQLGKTMRALTYSLLIMYLVISISFYYVGWLRVNLEIAMDNYCDFLDGPFGVCFRGSTLIFSTVQTLVIALFSLLICTKFKNLTHTTTLSMDRLSVAQPWDSTVIRPVKSSSTYKIFNDNDDSIAKSLDELSNNHQEITCASREINKSLGLQLLVAISSSLYTIVYYLYRYITVNSETTLVNIHERVHYVSGLLHRITKTTIYMILGRIILNSSLQPLEVIQRSRIINLPSHLQQQVQSLILQWSGKRCYLSAYGVINIGPWLLAPIVGNIITYLLVALQFDISTNQHTNVTALLDSIL